MNFWFYHFECRVYYYVFFFFNVVLMWKIVEASKVSVLYIYIYIDDKIYLEVTLL